MEQVTHTSLQSRFIDVELADLCVSMDLVAIVTKHGLLSVYRTVSWDRIYRIKCSEINSKSEDSTVCAIQFTPVFSFLAVAFDNGDCFILDLESKELIPCGQPPQLQATSKLLSCRWVDLQQYYLENNVEEDDTNTNYDEFYLQDLHESNEITTSNSKSSVGMNGVNSFAAVNQQSEENKEFKLKESFVKLTRHRLVLLHFYQDNSVVLYAFGIFPIFRIKLDANKEQSLHTIYLRANEFIDTHFNELRLDSNSDIRISSFGLNKLMFQPIASTTDGKPKSSFDYYQQLAFYDLQFSKYLTRIEEELATLSKKWREAIKQLPMKLNLVNTMITSYNLKFKTVHELYLSCCFAGFWHPIFASTFSQHWNEQGLSRLRESIYTTAVLITRVLAVRILPSLLNLYRLTREQMKVIQKLFPNKQELHAIWQERQSLVIRALFIYDLAFAEAQDAKENLTLFLQFVKSCFDEAQGDTSKNENDNEEDSDAKQKKKKQTKMADIKIRGEACKLFLPKRIRPPKEHGEYISSTFLLYHLQSTASNPSHSSQASGSQSSSFVDRLLQKNQLLSSQQSASHGPFQANEIQVLFDRHRNHLESIFQVRALGSHHRTTQNPTNETLLQDILQDISSLVLNFSLDSVREGSPFFIDAMKNIRTHSERHKHALFQEIQLQSIRAASVIDDDHNLFHLREISALNSVSINALHTRLVASTYLHGEILLRRGRLTSTSEECPSGPATLTNRQLIFSVQERDTELQMIIEVHPSSSDVNRESYLTKINIPFQTLPQSSEEFEGVYRVHSLYCYDHREKLQDLRLLLFLEEQPPLPAECREGSLWMVSMMWSNITFYPASHYQSEYELMVNRIYQVKCSKLTTIQQNSKIHVEVSARRGVLLVHQTTASSENTSQKGKVLIFDMDSIEEENDDDDNDEDNDDNDNNDDDANDEEERNDGDEMIFL